MREVRGQAMQMMFDTAGVFGLSPPEVRAGFGLGDHVPDRLDWQTFARGCDWLLERIGSAEAMARAARDRFVESSGTRAQVRLLRLFASPRALYWSLHRFGGHSLFSNATTEIESLSSTRLRFRVTMAGTPSMGFWVTCAGIIAAAPCAIGYPASVVRFEADGQHCDYFIEHTLSRSIVAKMYALFISVFARGSVFRELEEQKEALNAQLRDLEAAHHQAQQALALQARFLTSVTHELRTPLSGIIGLATMLDEAGTSDEERREAALQIERSAHHLLRLVNDVMALEGHSSPTLAPTHLESMIDTAVGSYALAVRKKGLALECTFAEGTPPTVTTDREWILHVLRCLLDNAVAFTARGRIAVRTSVSNDRLMVEVEDSGCGIAQGLQDQVFEPFIQGNGSLDRRHAGLGLGLPVARRLAQLLGGDVTVRSSPGLGSLFTFTCAVATSDAPQTRTSTAPHHTLPPAPSDAGAPATPPPAPGAAPRNAPPGQLDLLTYRPSAPAERRVLVVEDNPVNRKVLARMLTNLGVTVDCVENGLEAVEACTRQRYDIVFMDLQMPVMDGFTATEQIRRHVDVPIIAVTANSESQFRERARAVGMSGFVAKPISRQTVAEILSSAAEPRAVAQA